MTPAVPAARWEAARALAEKTMAAAREPGGAREPGYRYRHGLRVARLALALAEAEGVPPAPVARHNKRERVPVAAGPAAAPPARETDTPPDVPPEVRLVQDADLLDHFGAMEVWLGAYAAATAGETLEEALAVFASPRAEGWRRYALDHAFYRTTRERLRKGIAYADRFLARLRAEAAGWTPSRGPGRMDDRRLG